MWKKLIVTGIMALFILSLSPMANGYFFGDVETQYGNQYDKLGFSDDIQFQIPDWVINTGNVGVLMTIEVENTMLSFLNDYNTVTVTPKSKITAFSIDGITYSEYNDQVGNQKTTDNQGLDYFYVDNVKYESEKTSISTITTNSLGWKKPSVTDWKLWIVGDTYDDSTTPTNPFIAHFQIKQKIANQKYETNLIETGLRCPYNSTKTANKQCSNTIKIYMPLDKYPRASRIDVDSHISSIKSVYEYTTIQTVEIVSQSVDILWGLFHYEYNVYIPKQIRDLDNVKITREKTDLANPSYFFNIV